MNNILEIAVLGVYSLALTFILLYSLVQLNLVWEYLKKRKDKEKDPAKGKFPHVTVQLPVYNEKYVVKRLINSVANFEYPPEKLEIQVLDDSTDETVEIIATKVKELQELGFDISHVRRKDRHGYKAGALAYGLKRAKGEFIAIFDADFLPDKKFLIKTVPEFGNPEVGVVQSRWDHVNKDYSLLTRMQAFGLDAHFSVEQSGRNKGGHFINFNGTAGIWRKECIEDAGGWQSDTLTEDLDLSYRAQLKGWKFLFYEELGSPAELPATMSALKTQQFRWTKGAAECARKNLGKVLREKSLPFSTKVHAFFHLLNSTVFLCIVITALLSIPVLFIKNSAPELSLLFKLAGVFLICLPILAFFYWISFKRLYANKWKAAGHFIFMFPLFLSVSMGLSLHNALAVAEGYAGKKTPFIRTPKFNIRSKSDKWQGNQYLLKAISPLTILEIILTLYFISGIVVSFYLNDYGLLPFHIMLAFGFGYVAFYSLSHSRAASFQKD